MIWVHNARIFASIAVVLLHAAAMVVLDYTAGSNYWWTGNIYDSLVRWCVPVFVMVSGALLLDPVNREEALTFYKKRMSRVLVPLIFWSFFFLSPNIVWHITNSAEISFSKLFEKILYGTPYYHMWFLYMLLGLYLFTPLFRMLIEKLTYRQLLLFVCVAFLIAAVDAAFYSDHRPFCVRFLSFIPYYFAGYLFLPLDTKKYRGFAWTLFLISVAFTAYGCYVLSTTKDLDAGLYFYRYLSVTVIPMSISIMFLLKSTTQPVFGKRTEKLAGFTLGIYLIHPYFLALGKHAGIGIENYHPIIYIPVSAVAVYLASLLATWIVSKAPLLRRTV